MGEVRRELQGMWNWTKRWNLLLWKMTLVEGFGEGQNKCINWPRDRDVGARDDSRCLKQIKGTSPLILSFSGLGLEYGDVPCGGVVAGVWTAYYTYLIGCKTHLQHRLARYMGWTPWSLPMMAQWKEAPSTPSQLRNSWDFRCGYWNITSSSEYFQ